MRRFLVLLLLLTTTAARPSDLSSYEQAILELSNKARVENGLPPLQANPNLANAARGHSAEMVKLAYFDHESPTPGRRYPWDRLNQLGYDSQSVSENLYFTEGFPLAQIAPKAVDAWMHSADHRHNLLAPDITQMGIGLAVVGQQIYVTQVFSNSLEPYVPGN